MVWRVVGDLLLVVIFGAFVSGLWILATMDWSH